MSGRFDSRHWSQRWVRLAMVGTDAVVLYDLYKPIEIEGCGRGRCGELKLNGSTSGARFQVTRFWGMETCPYCARPFGVARGDETFYLGNSLEEAESQYQSAELSLFEYDSVELRSA